MPRSAKGMGSSVMALLKEFRDEKNNSASGEGHASGATCMQLPVCGVDSL